MAFVLHNVSLVRALFTLVQFYWIDGLFCGPIFCQKLPKDQLDLTTPSKTQADKTELQVKRARTKETCPPLTISSFMFWHIS